MLPEEVVASEAVGEVGAAVEEGVEEGVGVVGLVGDRVVEVAGQGTNTKTGGKATQNTQNQKGKKTLNIAGLSHIFKQVLLVRVERQTQRHFRA